MWMNFVYRGSCRLLWIMNKALVFIVSLMKQQWCGVWWHHRWQLKPGSQCILWQAWPWLWVCLWADLSVIFVILSECLCLNIDWQSFPIFFKTTFMFSSSFNHIFSLKNAMFYWGSFLYYVYSEKHFMMHVFSDNRSF